VHNAHDADPCRTKIVSFRSNLVKVSEHPRPEMPSIGTRTCSIARHVRPCDPATLPSRPAGLRPFAYETLAFAKPRRRTDSHARPPFTVPRTGVQSSRVCESDIRESFSEPDATYRLLQHCIRRASTPREQPILA